MTNLPKQYKFLATEPGPRMLLEALKLYGVKETPGSANNPIIMGWAKETQVKGYSGDIVPWCGLFMAVVAQRAGWKDHVPATPLWAQSWNTFGNKVTTPGLGDILVFKRPGGGHVGVYVGEDKSAYHVLGGNQKNAVNIIRIEKKRCIGIRRPKWRVSQPANVRQIFLNASGPISKNEE